MSQSQTRFEESKGNKMNSTFQSGNLQGSNMSEQTLKISNLHGGMSSQGQTTSTKMMQALVSRKVAQDQNTQLKARILKLQTEKERARKHINDMSKQQKLMTDMHNEKNDRRQTFANLRAEQKNVEDCDRVAFGQQKIRMSNSIQKNRHDVFNNNLNKGHVGKDQQKFHDTLVMKNRDQQLKQNQDSYKFGKTKWVNARNNMINKMNGDYKATQQYYNSRITDVDKSKQAVDEESKTLQKKEAALLAELQMTQKNEFTMVDKIHTLSKKHNEKFSGSQTELQTIDQQQKPAKDTQEIGADTK